MSGKLKPERKEKKKIRRKENRNTRFKDTRVNIRTSGTKSIVVQIYTMEIKLPIILQKTLPNKAL